MAEIKRIGYELEADIIAIEGKPHDISKIIEKLDKMKAKDELDFAYILKVKGFALKDLRAAYNLRFVALTLDNMFPVQAEWAMENNCYIVCRTVKGSGLPVGSHLS